MKLVNFRKLLVLVKSGLISLTIRGVYTGPLFSRRSYFIES